MNATQTTGSYIPVKVGCTVHIDGTPVLPVLSLQIIQTYADHHTLKLRFYHDVIQSTGSFTLEDASRLLGRLTEVVIFNTAGVAGDASLESKFVIADVQLEQSALGEGILCLTGYSPTWLLDGAPHYESFLGKSLSDIAGIVTKPLEQFRTAVKSAPTINTVPGYVSRFGETSWNFLKRLSADTGQWLYFDGSQLFFGAPGKGKTVPLIYGHNCYNLRIALGTNPMPTAISDYDPEADSLLSASISDGQNGEGSYSGIASRKSRELFAGPAVIPNGSLPPDKALTAAAAKAAASTITPMYRVSGESTIWELSTGMLVEVSFRRGADNYEHTPMRITAVTHHLDVTGAYHNVFEAIPASAELPPPAIFIRPRTHPVLAEVMSNIDPQGLGRVQVQMKGWVQEHSQQLSDWIRVISPDAGGTDRVTTNRGQVFLPEAGDQVMIDFLEGNPDKPYVTGSLFHGSNAAGQSHLIRTIMTKTGHTVSFDDNSGGTSITIYDNSGNTIFLDTQGANIIITAPETMTLNARNMKINVQQDMAVVVGNNKTEFIGKRYTHRSENMDRSVSDSKTEVVGNSLKQTSGEADIQTSNGDLKIRGTALAVFQGGKDVKVSKG